MHISQNSLWYSQGEQDLYTDDIIIISERYEDHVVMELVDHENVDVIRVT